MAVRKIEQKTDIPNLGTHYYPAIDSDTESQGYWKVEGANQIVETYLKKKDYLETDHNVARIPLGSGVNGPAFLTKSGTVLKFTPNSNEAASSLIIGLLGRKLKSQARVFKVYQIEEPSRTFWIIEKEYVTPIDDYLEDEGVEYDREIQTAIYYAIRKKFKTYEQFKKWMFGRVKDEIEKKTLEKLFRKKEKFMRSVYDFYRIILEDEKLSKENLDFQDIHMGNVGTRGHRLLCFDCVHQSGYSLRKGGKVGKIKSEKKIRGKKRLEHIKEKTKTQAKKMGLMTLNRKEIAKTLADSHNINADIIEQWMVKHNVPLGRSIILQDAKYKDEFISDITNDKYGMTKAIVENLEKGGHVSEVKKDNLFRLWSGENEEDIIFYPDDDKEAISIAKRVHPNISEEKLKELFEEYVSVKMEEQFFEEGGKIYDANDDEEGGDDNDDDGKTRRGGFLYEVIKAGANEDFSDRVMTAKNLKELKQRIIEKYGTTEGVSVARRSKTTGAFYSVNLEDGGMTEGNVFSILTEDEKALLEEIIAGNKTFYTDPETDALYMKLLDYYKNEMPYGIAKGRTGDPDLWLIERIEQENHESRKFTKGGKSVKGIDPSARPPKKWYEKMKREIKSNNPSYTKRQVSETIGDIWYHKLSHAKRKEIREREGKHYVRSRKEEGGIARGGTTNDWQFEAKISNVDLLYESEWLKDKLPKGAVVDNVSASDFKVEYENRPNVHKSGLEISFPEIKKISGVINVEYYESENENAQKQEKEIEFDTDKLSEFIHKNPSILERQYGKEKDKWGYVTVLNKGCIATSPQSLHIHFEDKTIEVNFVNPEAMGEWEYYNHGGVTNNSKMDIYYIKGDRVVTNISTSEQGAEEALKQHNQYLAKELGEGHIFHANVPQSEYEANEIRISNWQEWEPKYRINGANRAFQKGDKIDLQNSYEDYKNQKLAAAGFDVVKLSDKQKDLILEPSESPETYYQDGEISPKQAFVVWKKNLKGHGLSDSDIQKATAMHFEKEAGGFTQKSTENNGSERKNKKTKKEIMEMLKTEKVSQVAKRLGMSVSEINEILRG